MWGEAALFHTSDSWHAMFPLLLSMCSCRPLIMMMMILRRVFERDGVRVVCDTVSIDFLRGAVLEYEDSLMRSAFQVSLGSAWQCCSCTLAQPAISLSTTVHASSLSVQAWRDLKLCRMAAAD